MMIYPRDVERAIRQQRMVDDWAKSGLLETEQRDRIMPELQVDLRRTNKFLRLTLFVFGFIIVNAAIGLVAIFIGDASEATMSVLALAAASALFWLAESLIARYRLYRFGIEEAAAIASVIFFAIGAGLFRQSDLSSLQAFMAAAGGAFILFQRFGFVYAGVAAVLLVPADPDTQDRPPAGEQVERRPFLREIHWVAQREHQHHRPEAHRPRHPGQGR